MPICPKCSTKYPRGVSRCVKDNSVLVLSKAELAAGSATVAAPTPTPPTKPPASTIKSDPGFVSSATVAASGVARSRPPTGPMAVVSKPPSRPPEAWEEPTSEASGPPRTAMPTRQEVHLGRPSAVARSAPEPELRDVEIESGELPPGTQVGEYEVTKKLGEGGMGMVFAGIQPVIGKRVAIKVLAPELAKNAEIVRRFITEARAVNQIGHRNIIDIFSFGQLPDGRHYFVMEYLDGESLADRLQRLKVMRFDEGIPILLQICDALAAAHAKGIVHRDLKPDNVYCGAGSVPFVKLLDFGIAKLSGPEGAMTKTRTGVPMGTPLYMSPEQCRGIAVDYRTDIYALGIMMYEMFAGRTPFAAETYLDVITGHLSREPVPPSKLTDVPAPLEHIILKAVAKRPEDRYQSAAELAEELKAIQGSLPAAAPTLHPGAAAAIAAMASGAATSYPSAVGATAAVPSIAGAPSRRRVPVALLAVGFVIVAGGTALALFAVSGGKGGKGERAATPAPVAATGPAAPSGAAARPVQPATAPVAASLPVAPAKEPPKGTLTVVTGRPNAVVTVDGKEAGRGASVTVAGVTADTAHQVRVEAEGRRTEERSVTVAAGQARTETFTLHRTGGGRPAPVAAKVPAAATTKTGTLKPAAETKTPKKPAGTEETLKPW